MKCSVYRIIFTAWENLGKMLLASKLFLRRKSRKLRSRGKTECNLFSLTLKTCGFCLWLAARVGPPSGRFRVPRGSGCMTEWGKLLVMSRSSSVRQSSPFSANESHWGGDWPALCWGAWGPSAHQVPPTPGKWLCLWHDRYWQRHSIGISLFCDYKCFGFETVKKEDHLLKRVAINFLVVITEFY